MSDRDRQNPYNRGQQQGGYRNDGYDSPGQANQWQSDDHRQQGGDWQQDAGQRGYGDAGSYRFSGQGSQSGSQGYGRGQYDRNEDRGYGQNRSSSGSSYRSQLSDDDLRNDQRDASRNYERARGGYNQHQDRGGNDWRQTSSSQRGGSYGSYAGRDYDASGGNDFGNFTSEDYGGRDFYNRGGGATGGARSSESYRPSYGLSSWFNDDDDDRSTRRGQGGGQGRSQGRGREDYGSWREYGESRGFLQRASDEVASWFGDEDASRRRDQDRRDQDRGQSSYGSSYQSQGQSHRGRGPSNYTRSDERIREDANDHLTHDHHVDASNITVSVKDGELTLNGTVESRDAKRRAEDAVEHISGVKHVQNNLRVQERSSGPTSYGSSGSTGSTYGQSSGAGLTSASGLTGSSTTGSGAAGSGSAGSTTSSLGSSTTGSGTGASSTSGSSTSGTTGANTTSGIGSASTAGVSGGSTTKTS